MALYDVSTSEKKASPELVAGGTLYASAPIGAIFATMSTTAPSGFLMCDGTAYSATDYPELWAILPSTVKNTTNNTFTIDLREVTLKGAGLTGKTVGAHVSTNGLSVGEFLDDRVQEHTHTMDGTWQINAESSGTSIVSYGTNVYGTLGTRYSTSNPSGRKGATTEVKSVGVNYIIKAKMVAVPADFLAKVDEAVEEAISPTSGTIELNTGWLGTCKYSKSGNIVTLNFSQLRGNNTSVSTTIATLPSNLRPKESCYCIMWIDDTNNIQILNVTDTGAVTVGGTAGVRTAYAFGSVTFVTN